MPISLIPLLHNAEHARNIFAFSLIYSGLVFFIIFILMLTAYPKYFVDWAFTVREIALTMVFLLTGALILHPTDVEQYYRLTVAGILSVAATILVVALIRSHIEWRRAHNIHGFSIFERRPHESVRE